MGGEQGTLEQFLFPSPERTQWHLIHNMRALVIKTCCDHSRLQHNGVPSLFASPSNVGADAQLVTAEGGSQPDDHTVCERQSNPSVVVILVYLKSCLTVIMGPPNKS